jgi:uncharacterized protein involved in exopolysaccharide biosynthesis
MRKVADLSSSLADCHPRLIAARAELRDLRAKLSDEIRKFISSENNLISAAIAKERNL